MSQKKAPETYQKSSPEALEKARQLYLEGAMIGKISAESGINKSTLKYYVKKSWKGEREAMQSELVRAMSENKRADLVEITSYGLTFLKQTLKKMVDESMSNPSPGLLKTISTIVFEINKIKALDEGNPTEILADVTPSSTADIVQLLKKDPFLTIEDSYETIDCDSTDIKSEHSSKDN